MKKKHIFFVFFTLVGLILMAQKPTFVTRNPNAPLSGVSPKTADTLFRTAERTFLTFQSVANMRDVKTGKVTAESIDRFKEMFEFNTDIPEDFMFIEPPPVIKAADYAAFVYQYFRDHGLDVSFANAKFTSINYDALGFYRVYMETTKVMKNGLDKNLTKVVKRDSCTITQYFTFYIEKANIQKGTIFNIRNDGHMKCIKRPDHWSNSLSFFGALKAGIGFNQKKLNENWPSIPNVTGNSLNSESTRVFGGIVGGKYKLKGKPISLILGGEYDKIKNKIGIDSLRYELNVQDPKDPLKTPVVAGVTIVNLEESNTISVVRAHLGISYQVMQKEKFDFGFDFTLMPGRVTYYKNSITGTLRYDNKYTYPNPTTGGQVVVTIADNLPDKKYIVGTYSIADSLIGKRMHNPSQLFLGAQLAPMLDYHLTNHISLRVGVYFHFSLSKWLKPSDAPNKAPFGSRPSDLQYSIASEYVQRFKINDFGLQAGLCYQF
jgi:hypothetical protein